MWRFIKAQATGKSHLLAGVPCQDRLLCEVVDGALVAAVADGAGSAQYAERGAEIAVESLVDNIRSALYQKREDLVQVLLDAATVARQEVETVAAIEGAPIRDYASTLLAVVLTASGGAALQIGDGVIVVGEGIDDWSWVFWPQRGEYANTTYFLTDDDGIDRLQVVTLASTVADVAIMSDGLEFLALDYARQSVHQAFFGGVFSPLLKVEQPPDVAALSDSLNSFLASDRVGQRTDDDVTLIAATRR